MFGLPDLRFGIRADNRSQASFAAARRDLRQTEAALAGVRHEQLALRAAGAGLIDHARGLMQYSGLMRGLAAGAVVGGLARTAAGLAALGDEAERLGISAEALQRWQYVATLVRVPVEALTDALRELQLRGDEFAVTGGGGAAEAFGRLGLAAADVAAGLRDPARFLTEIIDRLHGLDRAAQIRITDELFGGSAGERFLAVLREAPGEIRRLYDTADDVGQVIDDKWVEGAREFDRALKLTFNWLKTQAVEIIGGVGTELAAKLGTIAAIADQLNRIVAIEPTNVGEDALLRLRAFERGEAPPGYDPAADRATVAGMGVTLPPRPPTMAERLADAFAPPPAVPAPGVPLPTAKPNVLGLAPPETGGADAAAREADALRELARTIIGEVNPALAAETALKERLAEIGKVRDAGLISEEDALAAIEAAQRAYNEAVAAADPAQQQFLATLQQIGGVGEGALRGLIGAMEDGIVTGEELAGVLADVLANLGNLLINAGFNALGNAGGWLGAIFGGARAAGGPVEPGRAYLVGERGPEIMVPDAAGTILPFAPERLAGLEGALPPPGDPLRPAGPDLLSQGEGRAFAVPSPFKGEGEGGGGDGLRLPALDAAAAELRGLALAARGLLDRPIVVEMADGLPPTPALPAAPRGEGEVPTFPPLPEWPEMPAFPPLPGFPDLPQFPAFPDLPRMPGLEWPAPPDIRPDWPEMPAFPPLPDLGELVIPPPAADRAPVVRVEVNLTGAAGNREVEEIVQRGVRQGVADGLKAYDRTFRTKVHAAIAPGHHRDR